MIIKTTPSLIRLEIDGRRITIQGEAAGMGSGMNPYFVAYANSIQQWDAPFEHEKLDSQDVQRILQMLVEDCRARNFPLEIE